MEIKYTFTDYKKGLLNELEDIYKMLTLDIEKNKRKGYPAVERQHLEKQRNICVEQMVEMRSLAEFKYVVEEPIKKEVK